VSLGLEHHIHDTVDVVTVVGDIDLYSAPKLREMLHRLLDGHPHDVVIDLSGVPFMDSMALGVLLGALKRARLAGGTVRLAGPNALATKVLRITGLIKSFSIHPDVADALAHPLDLPGTPGRTS
jgi:anti-sigma B factor antagonist